LLNQLNPYRLKLVRILFCFFLIQASAQEILSEEIAMSNGDILIPGTLSYPEL